MIRKASKTVPRGKSSLIVNFMISIIVLLPLRGCPLRCYFSMNIILNNLQDKRKEELFQCGGFLDMQIGMEPLVIDWAKEEPKMGQIIRHIYVYC